jgi:aerobic C4-dicarboxylate transport protein
MSSVAVTKPRPAFYKILYIQVLVAIAAGILLGNLNPGLAVEMKPLGDAFIKLIKMVIALVVFFTVVTGIAGMENMRKVGRVGGKALIYFEILSTLALLLGMIVAKVLKPGAGFNADPASLDTKAVAQYAGRAKDQGVVEFLLNIIPNTITDAFARGDILPVVLVSLIVGYALYSIGERGKPIRVLIDSASHLTFSIINLLMRLAPIGAFGAMAFTVGRYGISALGPLLKLVMALYVTSGIFVLGVLGIVAAWSGFSILKFLYFIRAEILIVLGTSSSDPVLPSLMQKLEALGCSKSTVGLVVPTGYIFNTDGSSIYMTMAALFVAQATNTELSLMQELAIFAVAMLTSKGASGVTGAGFIALVATLGVVPSIPVAGMALILGVDRFMSEARALVNVIGTGVATIAIARSEGELDQVQLNRVLNESS